MFNATIESTTIEEFTLKRHKPSLYINKLFIKEIYNLITYVAGN